MWHLRIGKPSIFSINYDPEEKDIKGRFDGDETSATWGRCHRLHAWAINRRSSFSHDWAWTIFTFINKQPTFFFFFLWHVWLISESNQRFLFSILLLRLHTEVLRFQYYCFSRSLPEPYITWVGVVYNHWWTIGPALTYQHLSQLFFSFQRCWVTIRTLEASNCISHRFHDKSMQHFSGRICIFPKLIPAFVSIKLVRASLVGRIN